LVCFALPGRTATRKLLKYQLGLIKDAFNNQTILLGDLSLDYFKKGSQYHQFKNNSIGMDELWHDKFLTKLIDFPIGQGWLMNNIENPLFTLCNHPALAI
jgi:hypothetical protein